MSTMTVPEGAELARNEVVSALRRQIEEIVQARVVEVRVTPVVSSRDGSPRMIWTVLALNAARREVPLPAGGALRVVALLKGFFPLVGWAVPRDYDVQSGVLAEHVPCLPPCLRVTS